MNFDEKKLNRQKEIVSKWIKNGYIGGVQAVTGFGKTYIAILAIFNILNKRPNSTIIVVVPTIYLQDQWIRELKKFKLYSDNIQVLVINTACKSDLTCNFLIVDEAHTSVAEVFIELYNNIKYDILLWLTATLERSDDRHKLLLEIAPLIDKVDILEALKEGYISDYKIYNIPVEFTEEELTIYNKIQKSYNYYEFLLGGRFDAWNNSNYYLSKEYKSLDIDEIDKNTNIKNALMFKLTVNKRKTCLYNAFNKIKLTKEIIDLFPDRKGIIFCESINFAEKLDNYLGRKSSIYHSGLKLQEKKDAISKFIDNRTSCNVMVSVRALDAGVDINGVGYGVACSGSSKSLQDTQRRGRSGRINKDYEIAYYFNIYVKDTQEEKWIKTKCYNIPNIYWIQSLEEIKDKI